MQAKILSALAILPLATAVSLIATNGDAKAAVVSAGDQLDIDGHVIVSETKVDFVDDQFEVTGTTGFFKNIVGQMGNIQDLDLAAESTFTGIIPNFLNCSNCTPGEFSFTFDLNKASRTKFAFGSTSYELLNVEGVFRSGQDASIIGTGGLSTKLPSNSISGNNFAATFTAEPVPEPTTTVGLLAAGAIGAVKASRRKKKEETPA